MICYNKKTLSITDQANLIISLGLICDNKTRLEGYLASIGYHRLKIYWLPFLVIEKKGSASKK